MSLGGLRYWRGLAAVVLLESGCTDDGPAPAKQTNLEATPESQPASTSTESPKAPDPKPAEESEHDELDQDLARVLDGAVRLDPVGCAPVIIPFTPPPGFEFVAGSEQALWRRVAGAREGREIQSKKAWPDHLELDVQCGDRPDAAQRKAANAKDVYVNDQSEHPFSSAADPELQAKRQAFEILTDEITADAPVLEFRNTYPDGVPQGFIYDHYEGRCWHHRPSSGLVLHVSINAPLKREAEGRRLLEELCKPLASVEIKAG